VRERGEWERIGLGRKLGRAGVGLSARKEKNRRGEERARLGWKEEREGEKGGVGRESFFSFLFLQDVTKPTP
jgi:hypothetical protein